MTRVNAILKRETIAHILLREVESSGDNAGNIVYNFFEDNRIEVHDNYLVALSRECFNSEEYNIADYADEVGKILIEVIKLLSNKKPSKEQMPKF